MNPDYIRGYHEGSNVTLTLAVAQKARQEGRMGMWWAVAAVGIIVFNLFFWDGMSWLSVVAWSIIGVVGTIRARRNAMFEKWLLDELGRWKADRPEVQAAEQHTDFRAIKFGENKGE